MAEINIVIAPDGTMSFIHHDDLTDLMEHGEARIRRASHVEPNDSGQWEADMGPSDGPVLGPFRTRGEALAAEVEWLRTNRGL